MQKKIKLIVAILVILASAYWAMDGVRARTYLGSKLSFNVGNGYVMLNNLSKDPITAEMRTESAAQTFRITSTDLGLNESSKRQGSGRTSSQVVALEIPSGEARIDIARGSKVQFVATSTGRLRAVVYRVNPATAQVNLRIAAVIILLTLFYISNLYNHQWVRSLISKLPLARFRTRRGAA